MAQELNLVVNHDLSVNIFKLMQQTVPHYSFDLLMFWHFFGILLSVFKNFLFIFYHLILLNLTNHNSDKQLVFVKVRKSKNYSRLEFHCVLHLV
jgi:hypothetical protein